MRSLVTGGAGFIGAHLVDALVQRGDDVAVLDNFSTGSLHNLDGGGRERVDIIRGDVRKFGDVKKAADEADHVFHLAACVGRSITFPRLDFETNALGTLNILRACRDSDVRRVVVASSVMVYGGSGKSGAARESDMLRPIIPYGASKAAAESLSTAFHHSWGVPTVVLRYFNVYGPRANPRNPYSGVVSRFMDRAARGLPPVIFGDGLQSRDFVYVDDVVKATLLAAERKKAVGGIFNVGSGIGTPINKLASMVLLAAGLEHLKPIHKPPRPHEYRHLHADTSKAREVLGFRNRIGLKNGLARTWSYLRKMA